MLQKLAWVYGVVFIVIGILGFIPAVSPGGSLLGVLMLGDVLSAIYVISGILAILAVLGAPTYTRLYFKVFGIIYALITIIGFVQGDTVLGLFVVNMADNLLHLVIAAVALWAGFGAKADMHMQSGVAM